MIKDELAEVGIKAALKLLHRDPDRALRMLVTAAEKLAVGELGVQIQTFKNAINRKDNVYRQLMRFLNEIDPAVADAFFTSFIVNANLIGWRTQNENKQRHGCNIPWAILLDPTSACNLKCAGCWAADYGNRLNLSVADIESIIEQGTALGTYLYIYTGGEPLVRKRDLIDICERHPDCTFLCFTNGTLIDEAFCKDLLRVKNFLPALSVEGDESTTDARRGAGTYAKVVRGMNLLHEHKLPFGISCCYTSANVDAVSSDAYFDQMIAWGASFVWYFHYMPVGSDANVDLMCTPDQREHMYHTVRQARATKDIFVMDFQNDGEFVQGCIAGGRRYLHINAAGDVDPCVFIHFSDSNIHQKTLLEALKSPLFMAYRDGQPFNRNMLMPSYILSATSRAVAAPFTRRREYGIKGVHGAEGAWRLPWSPALWDRLAPPARRWTWIRQDVVRRWMSNEVAPAVTRG